MKHCCSSCARGDACEVECPDNPAAVPRLLRDVVSNQAAMAAATLESKRYQLQCAASTAVSDILLVGTRTGWRPVIEDWWFTVGGGQLAATPRTLEFSAIPVNIEATPAAVASNRKRLFRPIAAHRAVAGGCHYVPRVVQSELWWNLFVSVGAEGTDAAIFNAQIVWVPASYKTVRVIRGGIA